MTKPDVVFQQSIFAREKLKERWPHLERVITSGDALAAAFEVAQRHPMWQTDPRLFDIPAGTAKEVLDLYNRVVADGRYIAELQTNPGEAAHRLGLEVSPEALEVVSSVAARLAGDEGPVGAAVVISISVVGIAVTTAIVSSRIDPADRIVIDESGLVKLGDEFRSLRISGAATRRPRSGRPRSRPQR